jgi:hypothetical protein
MCALDWRKEVLDLELYYSDWQMLQNREAHSAAREILGKILRRKRVPPEAVEAYLDHVDFADVPTDEAIAAAKNALIGAPTWRGGRPSVEAYRSRHWIVPRRYDQLRCEVDGMPVYQLRNGTWRHDPGRYLYEDLS